MLLLFNDRDAIFRFQTPAMWKAGVFFIRSFMKPEWIDFHLERYKSRSEWLLKNGDCNKEISEMRSFLMAIKDMCEAQRIEMNDLFAEQDEV